MAFIDPRQSYTYFNNNYSLRKSTRGWYVFKCPICNELESRKKAAVHFNYGVVKCWICGYKDNVVNFVVDSEGVSLNVARATLRDCEVSEVDLTSVSEIQIERVYSEVEMPYGFKSLNEGEGILAERARKYLSGRGFDLKMLDRMGVGYCDEIMPESMKSETNADGTAVHDDYWGYIILPLKQRGKLVYYIGRDFMGNFLRYKNPGKDKFGVGKADVIFNEDALYLYDEVFLLEGIIDAATIGNDATATLGWSLSDTQKRKYLTSDCEVITMVPDAGVDGEGVPFYLKALELALDFIEHKKVKIVDMNKAAEGKDVNSIGRAAFMELYHSTRYMTASEIMIEIFEYET